MNTRIQALTAGALAAIIASVAIPALTGAQASPARSARVAHARPAASQADQLRAIERRRLRALVDADTATAGGVMAGNFQAVPPSGDPLARKDYLGAWDARLLDGSTPDAAGRAAALEERLCERLQVRAVGSFRVRPRAAARAQRRRRIRVQRAHHR